MQMNPSFWVIVASIFGALGVAGGALGAHGLKGKISPEMMAVYETGIRYLFYHVFALMAVGIISRSLSGTSIHFAGWAFLLGILLFSGSLVGLALTGIKELGIITPIGGSLWIVGWIVLAASSRDYF